MSFLDTLNNVLVSLSTVRTQRPTEGFDINEFKHNVLRDGYLKPSLYLVKFSAATKTFGRNLIFYTDSVNLPPADVATSKVLRYGYGPEEDVITRPVFAPMSIKFLVAANSKNALTAAMNYMNGTTNFMNYRSMNDNTTLFGSSGNPYEVAYKDDYRFGLDVYVYNDVDQNILTYTFRDCLAKTVGGISLGWGSTDQLISTDVTFLYTDFTVQTAGLSSNLSGSNINALGLLQSVLGFASLSQTVSAIQYPQSVADAINVSNGGSITSGFVNPVTGNPVTYNSSGQINPIPLPPRGF